MENVNIVFLLWFIAAEIYSGDDAKIVNDANLKVYYTL